MHHQSSRGFSTIELLAALGIIGVVAAIAVPSTTRTMADLRLQSDGRNLHNAVALAKMRAAARYTRERIFVDLAAKSYQLQYWDKAAARWQNERDYDRRLSTTAITAGNFMLSALTWKSY